VFNTYYAWGIDPDDEGPLSLPAYTYDIKNIATHEAGHPVGLNDLYEEKVYGEGNLYSDLTMWGTSPYGETKKQSLEIGDINGVQAIYGP